MEAKPRLLEQVRDKLRLKHYSYRTEQQYLGWIRRFILHNGKRHPREMSGLEVEQFLTHLATEREVSASTQNQALSAILFLYQQVLKVELPWLENVVRQACLPNSCRALAEGGYSPAVPPRRHLQDYCSTDVR